MDRKRQCLNEVNLCILTFFSVDLLHLNFKTICCIEDTKRNQKQYGKETLLSVPLTEIIIQLKLIDV